MESLTTTEFEIGWEEMLVKYECREHDHIKRMWSARHMFVPAYFKGSFCRFTRTTGRSESFNSNFKEYVLRKDTIENFLKQYELFQENIIEIENDDRFQSSQKKPVFWCRQPIEHHAAAVYTKGIYLKFVTELLNSTAFGVTEVVANRVYELRKLFHYDHPEYRRSMFTVFVDRTNMAFECECGKFEKDGILCCHILRLFTQFDVVKIPDDYILPRWTIKFREVELMKNKQEIAEVHGTDNSQSALRYAMMLHNMNDICADISRDASKSREFIEEVHKLHRKLMPNSVAQSNHGSTSLVLKDPPVIKKATSKKSKQKVAEENLVSSPTEEGNNVEIWVHDDGSISKTERTQHKKKKSKTSTKNKMVDVEPTSSLKDPPVSTCLSVIKGNTLKPASEKKSGRKSTAKKVKA
jgi:hypothetical protein